MKNMKNLLFYEKRDIPSRWYLEIIDLQDSHDQITVNLKGHDGH